MPAWRGQSDPPTPSANSLAAVGEPASLVLLAENLGTLPEISGRDNRYNSTSGNVAYHESAYMNARTRHSGGANFAFVDGHAKWFKGPSDFRARSRNGVVWQRCDAPSPFACASGWFAPLSGALPATDASCR
jgi:prepilin-type processing-associated H-X9-DG protein